MTTIIELVLAVPFVWGCVSLGTKMARVARKPEVRKEPTPIRAPRNSAWPTWPAA